VDTTTTATLACMKPGCGERARFAIVMEHELFRSSGDVGQMSVGGVAHTDVLRSTEGFGTKVAPVVCAETTPA
jgi:hypothetical protein